MLSTQHATTSIFFFFNHPPTTEIYTLSLHDALPILKKFPAKNLDARDNSASRRERFLHQRRGVNAEIKPIFLDSAPQFFRRIETLDPRATAAHVWLDDHGVPDGLGPIQRLGRQIDDPRLRIWQS